MNRSFRTRLFIFAWLPMLAPLYAAPVSWVGTSGTWENAANWSSNPSLPGAADTVTINVAGSQAVSVSSVRSVLSLTTAEDLNILSGSLTVGSGGLLINGTGADLTVSAGATFTLNHNDFNGATTAVSNIIGASGLGALADFSSVLTITGNTFASAVLTFRASGGGTVNASAATMMDGGITRFIADGASGATPSTVNISSLTNFDGGNNLASRIEAINGGRVLMPGTSTTLDFVNLHVDAASTLDVTHIASYTGNGHATIDGVAKTFSALTNANGGGFIAQNGATIALPNVTAYSGFTGFVATDLKATGTGSLLDMSSVTTMTGNTFSSVPLRVTAEAAGTVDLSAVTTVTGGHTQFTATGAGSTLDLSSLTSVTHTGNLRSFITADTGGSVQLHPTVNLTLNDTDVIVSSTGTISGHNIRLVSSGSIFASSDVTGSGTLSSSLDNVSGLVAPGTGTSAAALTIGGSFVQRSGGELRLDIASVSSFDTLTITGDATLGGLLTVNLAGTFDLLPGMDFEVLDIAGTSSGVFTGLAQSGTVLTDNGQTLYIDYFGGDGNDVVLTTTEPGPGPIPEPGTMLFGFACLSAVIVRRRRAHRH